MSEEKHSLYRQIDEGFTRARVEEMISDETSGWKLVREERRVSWSMFVLEAKAIGRFKFRLALSFDMEGRLMNTYVDVIDPQEEGE